MKNFRLLHPNIFLLRFENLSAATIIFCSNPGTKKINLGLKLCISVQSKKKCLDSWNKKRNLMKLIDKIIVHLTGSLGKNREIKNKQQSLNYYLKNKISVFKSIKSYFVIILYPYCMTEF